MDCSCTQHRESSVRAQSCSRKGDAQLWRRLPLKPPMQRWCSIGGGDNSDGNALAQPRLASVFGGLSLSACSATVYTSCVAEEESRARPRAREARRLQPAARSSLLTPLAAHPLSSAHVTSAAAGRPRVRGTSDVATRSGERWVDAQMRWFSAAFLMGHESTTRLTPLGIMWLERVGVSMTCLPSTISSDVNEPPHTG